MEVKVEQYARCWEIFDWFRFQYPSEITVAEKEQIKLAAFSPKIDFQHLQLLQYENDRVVHDKIDHVSCSRGYLLISGLPPGVYKLFLVDLNLTVRIQVIQGSYWMFNKNFIINEELK